MTRSPHYPEPAISRALFASTAMAPIWTIVRIYLGWSWLGSGWGKVTNPAWVGPEAGGAVSGFLNGALAKTGGDHPSVAAWYGWMIENLFLPNAFVMSHLVALGEVLIGLALIVGFLTGISAFLGGTMNTAFLLAGTLSSNPVMFILATWLVLAWRTAGWYGLDRWVLPWLGAPRGRFGRGTRDAAPSTEPAAIVSGAPGSV